MIKLAEDSWTSKALEYDKWVHFAGCFTFTRMLVLLSADRWIAFAIVSIGGLLLEYYQGITVSLTDKDGFSWRDLVANTLGCIMGVL